MQEKIESAHKKDVFNDEALNQYHFYQFGESSFATDDEKGFLYICLLQAMRIAALFHDIGHPPFSHVIETVLDELYKKYNNDKENKKGLKEEKKKEFIEKLTPFFSEEEEKVFKPCICISYEPSGILADPHERIGLSLTQKALSAVISQHLDELKNNTDDNSTAIIIFYLLVAEFTIEILTNRNNTFHSFHTLIDGIVDSDRLDYVMRDGLNSGVDWGRIPYKRLIVHSRFDLYEKKTEENDEDKSPIFVFSLPKKTIPDINDFLVTRYKIFARINLHHRCLKNASVLQASVKMLAEDFLRNDDDNCINKDISLLWTALFENEEKSEYKILQWNDSWLITTLSTALIRLKENEIQNPELKQNLEEILLNKKIFYSIIKHGSDSDEFFDSIYSKSGITEEKLKEIERHEQEEIERHEQEEIVNDDKGQDNSKTFDGSLFAANDGISTIRDAYDSCERISEIRQAQKRKDFEQLFKICKIDSEIIKGYIENALYEEKEAGNISDYQVIINEQINKNGLPKTEKVFSSVFLQTDEKPEMFNFDVVSQEIEALRRDVPWVCFYIVPNGEAEKKDGICNSVKEKVANAIGLKLIEKFEALFPMQN